MDRFRHYTGWIDLANRREYDAPADPWNPLRVDPTAVDHWTVIEIKWGLGRVRGGEWDADENLQSVEELAVYEGFRERFEEGRDWTDTAYVERARERIEDGGTFRGHDDVDEFLAEECPAMDDLYERIRRDGYRANRGTLYETPADVDSPHDLEPLVLIGRSGEVVWTEGFHRFVIARLLGVDTVPVYVVRRHERWQAVRERVAQADDPERALDAAPLDHPDLDLALDQPDLALDHPDLADVTS